MTTKKKTRSKTTLEEVTLAERAYSAYLAGRLAGLTAVESPARNMLVQRYAATNRQPCEVFTFLTGFRESGCPLLCPDELLSAVCASLGMAGEVLQ